MASRKQKINDQNVIDDLISLYNEFVEDFNKRDDDFNNYLSDEHPDEPSFYKIQTFYSPRNEIRFMKGVEDNLEEFRSQYKNRKDIDSLFPFYTIKMKRHKIFKKDTLFEKGSFQRNKLLSENVVNVFVEPIISYVR
jgi:hypothetical protein